MEDIYNILKQRVVNEDVIVFLGSNDGTNITYIIDQLQKNNITPKIIAVDEWLTAYSRKDMYIDSKYSEFLFNIKDYKNYITIIRDSFSNASSKIDDKSINFCINLVSSNYKDLKNFIVPWYPKIIKKGLFIGRYYDVIQYPGVVEAVDSLLPKREIISSSIDTFWIYEKNI